MSDAKGNQEPSMEEILASIRRIISEDGEPKEDPAAPAVNGHAAEEPEEEDDDALVLTDMVVGDSNVVELQEEPAPAVPPAPPQAAAPPPPAPPPPPLPEPEVEPEPELEALPEPEVAIPEDSAADIELDTSQAPASDTSEAMMDDGLPVEPIAAAAAGVADAPMGGDLVSPDVAAASAATMAQLVAKKPQLSPSRHTSIDGLLVETLVRQAIEPMLKEWLDEHLQEIVERLVRREVERLSRKAELS